MKLLIAILDFLGFRHRKDGGQDSHVTGWFLEWKWLFTIAVLRFGEGTRDAYHSHAFNSVSLVLSGCLTETFYPIPNEPRRNRRGYSKYSIIWTSRSDLHKVYAWRTTWILTVRGPWASTWMEVVPVPETGMDRIDVLTKGRKVVGSTYVEPS